MSAQLLIKDQPVVHDLNIMTKMLWQKQSAMQTTPRYHESSPKRCFLNPNRMISDLLSSFENQLYSRQVHLEVQQSKCGVLHVDKMMAENIVKLLLGRILSITEAGATLQIDWIQGESTLTLNIKLKSAPQSRLKGIPGPLMPLQLNLMRQLDEGGIRYRSNSSSGPWQLVFDSSNI
jgi:hypothetical protein